MTDLSAIGLALNWWLIGSYKAGSVLWFEDIHEFACALHEFVRNGANYLTEIASSLVEIIAKIVCAPFSVLAGIFISVRELVILLGSSCLFLISLPPLFLFYFIDTVLHLFNTLGTCARSTARRFTEHAADLETLEILVGLVVSCGLIGFTYNGMKFLVKSYSNFKPWAIKSLRVWWRRLKTIVKLRRKTENDDCKLKETESCIVCLTKARSVCLLPCRHLCLCVTCTESLPHPLRCPLCRQRTEDILHVYI